MRTIRRLYFYAVAFISLEVVLWGSISLLRILVTPQMIGLNTSRLAGGLALILVGVPVFGLHWWVVQRDARRDMDEHASALRAVFLYAAMLSTLIPVLQNFIAMFNRLLLQASRLELMNAVFGSQQSWSDNLIALLMNALMAVYFLTVLRQDWKQVTVTESFIMVRRIARYIWVLYGLGLTVAGVQQVLQFLLQVPSMPYGPLLKARFINGLALTLAGTPVWVMAWKTVQDGLSEQAERDSLLRLGLLYFLSLAGVITVLASGGIVLYLLLRLALGEQIPLATFFQQLSSPVSIGIPLAGIWGFYDHWLRRSLSEVPDAPRRLGMRRLYAYILSAIGLGAAFIGLQMLLAFVVDALTTQAWSGLLVQRLAAALATLGAGLPLWLLTWRSMQAEALSAGTGGEHARRSLVRRIYLYLALFASVIGGMVFAGSFIYRLVNSLLGVAGVNLLAESLKDLERLALFILLGVYHGLSMRRDGKTAGLSLEEKQATFRVLVFDVQGGDFGAPMLQAIHKQAPHLNAAIQEATQPLDKEVSPGAIILPASLALALPAGLQKWLAKYEGARLVVPTPAPGWVWVGNPHPDLNQAALAVRQLAEGQELRQKTPTTPWMVVLYVMAALFGLELLLFLFSMVASLIFR